MPAGTHVPSPSGRGLGMGGEREATESILAA
jgi:hypothetical protein